MADEQPQRQAKAMTWPRRLPLVNTQQNRNSNLTQFDARLVNAFAEKDVLTGDYWVTKRPGLGVPVINPGALYTPGQGIYTQVFDTTTTVTGLGYQTVYCAGNNVFVLYTDPAGVQTTYNLGPVTITGPPSGLAPNTPIPQKARFLSVPGSPLPSTSAIIFGSGYYGSSSGGGTPTYAITGIGPSAVLTTLTTGSPYYFPANTVPGFVYLNGNTFVMDYGGTIWMTSAPNQVFTWYYNQSTITAAVDADMGVLLARQGVYMIAFKQWTTQVFYDAGNPSPASTLSPLPGAIYNVGCLHPDTVADLDGVLFWVTNSHEGTYQVAMLDNLQYSVVSTPPIERILDDTSVGTFFYSYAFQHAGHKFYIITANNQTMVYDVGQKLWYVWTTYDGLTRWQGINRTVAPNGDEWHQLLNGIVYTLDDDYIYPNDYGNIFPVDIYTPNFDGDIDRQKYLSQMRFNADQTNGSTLFVRCSDDDYQTWTNFRKVNLAKNRPILNDCGTFYRRAYHFRHYANTPLRIKSVDLQCDIGTL